MECLGELDLPAAITGLTQQELFAAIAPAVASQEVRKKLRSFMQSGPSRQYYCFTQVTQAGQFVATCTCPSRDGLQFCLQIALITKRLSVESGSYIKRTAAFKRVNA